MRQWTVHYLSIKLKRIIKYTCVPTVKTVSFVKLLTQKEYIFFYNTHNRIWPRLGSQNRVVYRVWSNTNSAYTLPSLRCLISWFKISWAVMYTFSLTVCKQQQNHKDKNVLRISQDPLVKLWWNLLRTFINKLLSKS